MDALLGPLSYIFWVALALGILVFVHELGHFLTARMFGMRVDAFSLGFPPNLLRKRVGQTEYRLGAVPLGGYVKIAGMVDESMDLPFVMEPVLDAEGNPVLDDDGEPQLRKKLDARGRPIPTESEPQPDEYRSKPVWQRMVVITAGVVFNLIFAWAIYSALAASQGRSYTPAENVRLEVAEGSVADEIGLRTGDRIVSVNGAEVERFEDVFSPQTLSASPLRLTVDRGGQPVDLTGPDALMTRLSVAAREAGRDADFLTVFGAGPQRPPVLRRVSPGGAAADAGLQAGDRIVAVDGQPVDSWSVLTNRILTSGGEPLLVRWARPDSLGAAPETIADVGQIPGATLYENIVTPVASGERYLLGIELDETALGVRYERFGLGEAVVAGGQQAAGITGLYFGFVGKLFTGRESVTENVGGPLMIARESKEAADRGGASFWSFVAFLSIALAVFNILPIPALDGGHLVFLVYEAIARREPPLKVRMVVQQIGFALILALMVFVIFNDARRWFG